MKVSVCLRLSALPLAVLLLLAIVAWPATGVESGRATFELVASVPVAEVPWGAMVDGDVEGDTPHGPQALAVADDGSIYMADSIQRQVLVLNKGDIVALPVPEATYISDLEVTGGHMYVLDASDRIFDLDIKGRLLRVIPLPAGLSHLDVHRLVAATDRPGEILLWCANYLQYSPEDLPQAVDPALCGKGGVETVGVSRSLAADRTTARGIRFIDENLVELVDGLGRPVASVTPVAGGIGSALLSAVDEEGRSYVLVEEVGGLSPVEVELSLRVYSRGGALVGAVRIPLEDMVNVPHKPVAVTPRGDIYCLVPGPASVNVYRVFPGPTYRTQLRGPGSGQGVVPGGDSLASQRLNGGAGITANVYGKFKGYPLSQTRSSTRSRAYQMCDYSWTWRTKYDYFADGTPRPSTIQRPSQLTLPDGAATSSIPYCWGGWDSLWTCSDNWQWTHFPDALAKYTTYGPLVGKTNSQSGWVSGTCGIDCAGFVAAAADAYYCGVYGGDQCYKPDTNVLQSDGKVVSNIVGLPSTTKPNYTNLSGMQPLSFFVKSAHTLYYDYRKQDGSGIATVESTTSAPVQGATRYSRAWSELSGYYCRDWWPKQMGDDFDQPYTTKTGGTKIKGTQAYYKFQAAGTSTTVTVTRSSGDPDLYIYDASYAFLAKSDNVGSDSVTFSTTPGAWYYAKVHAWIDCSYSITW